MAKVEIHGVSKSYALDRRDSVLALKDGRDTERQHRGIALSGSEVRRHDANTHRQPDAHGERHRKSGGANPHHQQTIRFGGEKVMAFLDDAGLVGAPGMHLWRKSFLVGYPGRPKETR